MDRKTLIESNLRYAEAAATRYTLGAKRNSVQWKDAFSVACEALVRAADGWRADGGASFAGYAWQAMKNAIYTARLGEKKRWSLETTARHGNAGNLGSEGAITTTPGDARDSRAEKDEYRAALSDSPEDLLIEAQERALGQDRLRRVSESGRDVVEAVLEGRSLKQWDRLDPAKLAAQAGVRVPASMIPEKKNMTAAERSRRHYARMSPEKRAEKNRKQRAREALNRAGVAA